MSEDPAAAHEAANEKHDEGFRIIVNGEPKVVESEVVSYEEVVQLAYPTPPAPGTRFTVTFRNAREPKEGSLAPGQSVVVKKAGTIFNVKTTGKS